MSELLAQTLGWISGHKQVRIVVRGMPPWVLQQIIPTGLVTYEAGQTYTLAWPPKNHAAATCTNQFIPDTFLRLYMAPYDQAAGDPTQEVFRESQLTASFSDDPHVRNTIDFKGFQNCPRFCDDTDKSLCTGTFT
eukprot:UN10354